MPILPFVWESWSLFIHSKWMKNDDCSHAMIAGEIIISLLYVQSALLEWVQYMISKNDPYKNVNNARE